MQAHLLAGFGGTRIPTGALRVLHWVHKSNSTGSFSIRITLNESPGQFWQAGEQCQISSWSRRNSIGSAQKKRFGTILLLRKNFWNRKYISQSDHQSLLNLRVMQFQSRFWLVCCRRGAVDCYPNVQMNAVYVSPPKTDISGLLLKRLRPAGQQNFTAFVDKLFVALIVSFPITPWPRCHRLSWRIPPYR